MRPIFVFGAALCISILACKQQSPVQKVLGKMATLDPRGSLYEMNHRQLEQDLAEAYLEENRPDEAIETYKNLIEEFERSSGLEKLREYRRVVGKHDMDALLSSVLIVDIIYYNGLAKALKAKGDEQRHKDALAKIKQLGNESKGLKEGAAQEKTASLDRLLKK